MLFLTSAACFFIHRAAVVRVCGVKLQTLGQYPKLSYCSGFGKKTFSFCIFHLSICQSPVSFLKLETRTCYIPIYFLVFQKYIRNYWTRWPFFSEAGTGENLTNDSLEFHFIKQSSRNKCHFCKFKTSKFISSLAC